MRNIFHKFHANSEELFHFAPKKAVRWLVPLSGDGAAIFKPQNTRPKAARSKFHAPPMPHSFVGAAPRARDGMSAAEHPAKKPMAIMLPPRFDPDPAIDAQWLAIESRLEKLEMGIRDWRISLGLPADDTAQTFTNPAAALLPFSGEESHGEDALPDAIAAVAALPEPTVEEYRQEGVRFLKLAGRPDATGTELVTAAENFYRAYANGWVPPLQADDIANCGICLWFAALAFFRVGARLNLRGCKSGAPEELLLTIALKPSEFPGGDVGRHLRGALNPQHIGQLVRLVELAMLCFRKGAELAHGGIGTLWQVILYRGIGSFADSREASKAAGTPRGIHPGISTDALVSGIAGYEADFARLTCAPCTVVVPVSDWLNRTVLHSMVPICQVLEGEPSLASAKLENHQRLLGSAAGVALASQATVRQAAIRDRLAREEEAA